MNFSHTQQEFWYTLSEAHLNVHTFLSWWFWHLVEKWRPGGFVKSCSSTSVAVYALLVALSPRQGGCHWGRSVQLWALRGLWDSCWGCALFCLILTLLLSAGLLRDNAVTTCSIKQPQPEWQMCGSMTVVKDLVNVWQRQRNPSGYVLYEEEVVSLCQHCRLRVKQMWLW